MRSIASDEHAARSVIRHFALVDPEGRQPNGIIGNKPSRTALIQNTPELYQASGLPEAPLLKDPDQQSHDSVRARSATPPEHRPHANRVTSSDGGNGKAFKWTSASNQSVSSVLPENDIPKPWRIVP